MREAGSRGLGEPFFFSREFRVSVWNIATALTQQKLSGTVKPPPILFKRYNCDRYTTIKFYIGEVICPALVSTEPRIFDTVLTEHDVIARRTAPARTTRTAPGIRLGLAMARPTGHQCRPGWVRHQNSSKKLMPLSDAKSPKLGTYLWCLDRAHLNSQVLFTSFLHRWPHSLIFAAKKEPALQKLTWHRKTNSGFFDGKLRLAHFANYLNA